MWSTFVEGDLEQFWLKCSVMLMNFVEAQAVQHCVKCLTFWPIQKAPWDNYPMACV